MKNVFLKCYSDPRVRQPHLMARVLPLWFTSMALYALLVWPSRAMEPSPKIYFEDVTEKSGLKLERVVSMDKRYLIETMGGGAAFFDYDRDGWLDVYLTNTPTVQSFKSGRLPANRLYRNNHDGTFTDVSEKAGVAVGDYDRDGRLDIAVTNFSEEAYSLFRNQGTGNFTDAATAAGISKVSMAYLGWGMFFGDFDNDGWDDLFAANGHVYPQVDRLDAVARYRQRCLVFRNLGRGNFADVTAEAGAGVNTTRAHRGAALGDYDNDGDLDVLLLDLDGGPTLLENRSRSLSAYLRIKAPVGSRITVEAAGMKQLDEIRASGSYQSASEQVAHFGLGGASIVERVSVRFPNGKTRTLTNVKVNQLLTLE